MCGENGFGVKLHAEYRNCFMGKRHKYAVIRMGGRTERAAFWQFGDQRMIAPCHKGGGNVVEKVCILMIDVRGLAVYGTRRAENAATKSGGNRLMAETDAEKRDAMCGGSPDEINGNACFIWSAGTGGEQNGGRLECQCLLDADLIRADGAAFKAQLADIAGEVVNEAVEIINDEDHAVSPASTACSLTPSASHMLRALARVSSYSAAGSESATMPPPA